MPIEKIGKGGGLALIAKSNYQVSECDTGSTKSFEFATWKLHIRGAPIHITAIYHPPYSLKICVQTACSLMTSLTSLQNPS